MFPLFFASPTSASWPGARNYNIAVFAAARRARQGMTAHAERNDGVHSSRAVPGRMPLRRRTSTKVRGGGARVGASAARAADPRRGAIRAARALNAMAPVARIPKRKYSVLTLASQRKTRSTVASRPMPGSGDEFPRCAGRFHWGTSIPPTRLVSLRNNAVEFAQLPQRAASASDVPQPRRSLLRRGCPGAEHARAPSVRVVRACDTT